MLRSPVPRLRLVTDAITEPLALADAKAYARVDLTDDDVLFTALIKAARRRVEKETGLALMTQSWVAVIDRWPDGGGTGLAGPWWDGVKQAPISLVTPTLTLEIPKRPFQSVTNIKLRDAYGVLTTVDPTIYFVEISDMRGRVNRVLGTVWPTVVLAASGAIEIAFNAGFDASPYSGVPDDLMVAMRMLIKNWYDNREPIVDGRAAVVPHHIQEILNSYRAARLR